MQKPVKPSEVLIRKVMQSGITQQSPCCPYHYAITLANFMGFGMQVGSHFPEITKEYCEKVHREISVNTGRILEVEECEAQGEIERFIYELGDYNIQIPTEPEDFHHA